MAKILIIDDEKSMRDMLTELFSKDEFSIETASNGIEGLVKFQNNPADIVITDVYMPDKNGLGVIRDLRSNYKGMKIIAISGGFLFNSRTSLQFAKKIGADCCFLKPIDMVKLHSVVTEYVTQLDD